MHLDSLSDTPKGFPPAHLHIDGEGRGPQGGTSRDAQPIHAEGSQLPARSIEQGSMTGRSRGHPVCTVGTVLWAIRCSALGERSKAPLPPLLPQHAPASCRVCGQQTPQPQPTSGQPAPATTHQPNPASSPPVRRREAVFLVHAPCYKINYPTRPSPPLKPFWSSCPQSGFRCQEAVFLVQTKNYPAQPKRISSPAQKNTTQPAHLSNFLVFMSTKLGMKRLR